MNCVEVIKTTIFKVIVFFILKHMVNTIILKHLPKLTKDRQLKD